MTTLADFRTRLRKDLHDEDANNYRWTDTVLDRHIAKAVQEFSIYIPKEVKTTFQTTIGSRDIDISSLTNVVALSAVEYPVGKYPPIYVRFSLWGTTLTLLTDSVPSAVENVYVYSYQLHTVDAQGSTIPIRHEDLITLGASAYAAIEWASYATGRVNVGGEDTVRNYLLWGKDRLEKFHKAIARLSYKHQVRAVSLYVPARPSESQTTDPGP